MFGDNEIEITKKPMKKQKENPVGCTGKSKRLVRKYKRRVKRRYDGNRVGIEFGSGVTLCEVGFNSE